MRLDRKFLLIAPTITLVFIVAGLFYTTTRLRLIIEASDSLASREAFVASVERGQRQLSAGRAATLVRFALEAERRRTEAIEATQQLLLVLAWMALGSCALLLWTIRKVPRTEPLRGPVLFRSSP
jgi:hypothetical protein